MEYLYDIVLLTDPRYIKPNQEAQISYVQNILTEARLLTEALEAKGLRVGRVSWDNPTFDWSTTRYAIFRTTWDYFDRFEEFSKWLTLVQKETILINPIELLYWNMDKHYLQDLSAKGINIPPTVFIETGNSRSLADWVADTGWEELVLKPAVSGAGRHTYRFKAAQAADYEAIFQELIAKESMLLQDFQKNILTKGEVAFMAFGGKILMKPLQPKKYG